MRALQAILFDVDGTLADTEGDGHRKAYNLAFHQLGLTFRWGPRLYRKLLAQPGGRERLNHYLNHYQPELGAHAKSAAEKPQAWVARVHDLKSRHYRRIVRSGQVPLRAGVARLMREAHDRGLLIGVVTNASRASLKPLFQYSLGSELTALLDTIVSGEDVFRKKPAPDLYQAALKNLRLQPDQCLAVEDSAMGLKSATAAGIATLIAYNGDTENQDFSAALLVLDSLGDPGSPAQVRRGALSANPWVSVPDLQRLFAKPRVIVAPLYSRRKRPKK